MSYEFMQTDAASLSSSLSSSSSSSPSKTVKQILKTASESDTFSSYDSCSSTRPGFCRDFLGAALSFTALIGKPMDTTSYRKSEWNAIQTKRRPSIHNILCEKQGDQRKYNENVDNDVCLMNSESIFCTGNKIDTESNHLHRNELQEENRTLFVPTASAASFSSSSSSSSSITTISREVPCNGLSSHKTDIGALFGLAAVSLVFTLLPPPDVQFLLTDPALSYRSEVPVVPNGIASILTIGLPLLALLLSSHYLVRNHSDTFHAMLGMLQALALSLLVVSLGWCTIGGLRPNFLARCKPNPSIMLSETEASLSNQSQSVRYYYRWEVCTGRNGFLQDLKWNRMWDLQAHWQTLEREGSIADAMRAFPSGHAAFGVAAWGFFSLYWNAKLKANDNHIQFWKIVIVYIPVVFSLWIGSTRVRDYHHTWPQVIAGFFIGVLNAFISYRIYFSSWFGSDNHLCIHTQSKRHQ